MSIVPPRILRPDAGGRRTGVWSRRSADWTFLRILEQYLESVLRQKACAFNNSICIYHRSFVMLVASSINLNNGIERKGNVCKHR